MNYSSDAKLKLYLKGYNPTGKEYNKLEKPSFNSIVKPNTGKTYLSPNKFTQNSNNFPPSLLLNKNKCNSSYNFKKSKSRKRSCSEIPNEDLSKVPLPIVLDVYHQQVKKMKKFKILNTYSKLGECKVDHQIPEVKYNGIREKKIEIKNLVLKEELNFSNFKLDLDRFLDKYDIACQSNSLGFDDNLSDFKQRLKVGKNITKSEVKVDSKPDQPMEENYDDFEFDKNIDHIENNIYDMEVNQSKEEKEVEIINNSKSKEEAMVFNPQEDKLENIIEEMSELTISEIVHKKEEEFEVNKPSNEGEFKHESKGNEEMVEKKEKEKENDNNDELEINANVYDNISIAEQNPINESKHDEVIVPEESGEKFEIVEKPSDKEVEEDEVKYSQNFDIIEEGKIDHEFEINNIDNQITKEEVLSDKNDNGEDVNIPTQMANPIEEKEGDKIEATNNPSHVNEEVKNEEVN